MAPPSPVIRPAVEADAAEIVRMVRALAGHTGHEHLARLTVDSLRRFVFRAERPFMEALIAEAGGQAVGLCNHYPIFSTWLGGPGVFILDVYVDEVARDQGLGRRLLAETAAISAARGGVFMKLDVDLGNGLGRAVYDRMGFDVVGEDEIRALRGEAFRALAAEAKT